MISHDLGEVLKMCNRVFVLENGMISKHGSPIDILCESNNTKRNKLKTEIIKIQNKPNYTELSL